MPRVVVELTNRCNLACQHCFSGRHGGKTDLPFEVLERVVADANTCGFDHLCFTGGEPTLYPHFSEALHLVAASGYAFSFVSNGQMFPALYPKLLPYRAQFRQVTFSLDGATETSHDRLRGKGAYRRVLQAASVCTATNLPFSLNMVLARHNRHEVRQMVQLAGDLGATGLRFGHLMHSPLTTAQGSDLTPAERKQVEAEVWALKQTRDLPIGFAPGHHTTAPFPCAPLNLQEVNVDCHGYLTKCCHLSSHGGEVGQSDRIGHLSELGFAAGVEQLRQENERFRAGKLARLRAGSFQDEDYFPCWYCSNHYRKLDWLEGHEAAGWTERRWANRTAPQDLTEAS